MAQNYFERCKSFREGILYAVLAMKKTVGRIGAWVLNRLSFGCTIFRFLHSMSRKNVKLRYWNQEDSM